jgi:hypothetical protein
MDWMRLLPQLVDSTWRWALELREEVKDRAGTCAAQEKRQGFIHT